VRLFICYGTYRVLRPGGHPCRNAAHALREAGYQPEIIRSYGAKSLPKFLNRTRGRREVESLTGSRVVPVLAFDDGMIVAGGREIVAWAKENPSVSRAAHRADAGSKQ
jgi:hypothetical protein